MPNITGYFDGNGRVFFVFVFLSVFVFVSIIKSGCHHKKGFRTEFNEDYVVELVIGTSPNYWKFP